MNWLHYIRSYSFPSLFDLLIYRLAFRSHMFHFFFQAHLLLPMALEILRFHLLASSVKLFNILIWYCETDFLLLAQLLKVSCLDPIKVMKPQDQCLSLALVSIQSNRNVIVVQDALEDGQYQSNIIIQSCMCCYPYFRQQIHYNVRLQLFVLFEDQTISNQPSVIKSKHLIFCLYVQEMLQYKVIIDRFLLFQWKCLMLCL